MTAPIAATQKLYIKGRPIKNAQSVNHEPEGGETTAIPGITDDGTPIGTFDAPRGLETITFTMTPLVSDPDYQLVKQLESTRERFACMIKLGTDRTHFISSVVQPLGQAGGEGGKKADVSVTIKALRKQNA